MRSLNQYFITATRVHGQTETKQLSVFPLSCVLYFCHAQPRAATRSHPQSTDFGCPAVKYVAHLHSTRRSNALSPRRRAATFSIQPALQLSFLRALLRAWLARSLSATVSCQWPSGRFSLVACFFRCHVGFGSCLFLFLFGFGGWRPPVSRQSSGHLLWVI